MKSAAGEKLQEFFDSQKEKSLSYRKDQVKLYYNVASNKTLSSADWHADTKDILISFCKDKATGFLLQNKLCWTVANITPPLELQMHVMLLYLPSVMHTHAMHTRFGKYVPEGKVLKHHSVILTNSNCKKLQETRV